MGIPRQALLNMFYQLFADKEGGASPEQDEGLTRKDIYQKFIAVGKPNIAYAVLHKTSDLDTLKSLLADEMIDASNSHIPGLTEDQAGRIDV